MKRRRSENVKGPESDMTLHVRPAVSKQTVQSPPRPSTSSAPSALAVRKARERAAAAASQNSITLGQPSASSSSDAASAKKRATAENGELPKQQRAKRGSPVSPNDPRSGVPDSLFHDQPHPRRIATRKSALRTEGDVDQQLEPSHKQPARKTRATKNSKESPKEVEPSITFAVELSENSSEFDDDQDNDAPAASTSRTVINTRLQKQSQTASSSDDTSVSNSSDQESVAPVQSDLSTPRLPSPPSATSDRSAALTRFHIFQPEAGRNAAYVTFQGDHETGIKYGIAAGQRGILLAIPTAQSLSLCGTAQLRVMSGEVDVHQAVFRPESSPLNLFAPSTHTLPRITALASDVSHPVLNLFLSSGGTVAPSLPLANLATTSAVVLISPLSNTGIEKIESLVKLSGIIPRSGDMWTQSTSAWSGTGFQLLSEETPSFPLAYPEDWTDALKQLQVSARGVKSPICVSVGPKRAGKSTISKCAVNGLLQTCPRVAWLDLDLGQSEFTPYGLVSLHVLDQPVVNPNFAQQKHPFRAHHIGDNNPSQDPDFYLAAVQNLVSAYRALDAQDPLPLIVNTYGSAKGLTADLLDTIMNDVCPPTHALRFTNAAQDVAPGPMVLSVTPLPDTDASRSLTAADHRTLAQLSYFHSTSNGKWDFERPLSAQPFMSIKWTDLQQIHIVGSEVDYAYSLSALNASIVGLVASEEPQDGSMKSGVGQLPYRQLATLPDPALSRCIGFAIVRSINKQTQELHLLTPTSGEQLEPANVLVRGKIELPMAIFVHGGSQTSLHGVPWDQVPYLESSFSKQSLPGDTKRHIRRNAVRGGQAQG